jgi:hypothetical protein
MLVDVWGFHLQRASTYKRWYPTCKVLDALLCNAYVSATLWQKGMRDVRFLVGTLITVEGANNSSDRLGCSARRALRALN